MKITQQDWVRDLRQNMFNGPGEVELMHICPNGTIPGIRLFARITLEPGCGLGEHAHEGETEIYTILAGTAAVTLNGAPSTLAVGDTMVTHNAKHSLANEGDVPLVVLAQILLDT